MSLHWYACISTNTCCFEMHYILLETNWWALPNASSIVRICPAIHEILADEAFTATDVLISQSFVVAFVHPAYVRIALIWGFPAQLSLWKSVHWLWRYKLNEVCDKVCGHSLPFLVSRHRGLILSFALQHQLNLWWFSDLWGPLHFMHFEPWILQEKVEWPHFQQFLHWGIPGFALAILTVVIYLPTLKHLLIRSLALIPLWASQMSIHTIAILL